MRVALWIQRRKLISCNLERAERDDDRALLTASGSVTCVPVVVLQ